MLIHTHTHMIRCIMGFLVNFFSRDMIITYWDRTQFIGDHVIFYIVQISKIPREMENYSLLIFCRVHFLPSSLLRTQSLFPTIHFHPAHNLSPLYIPFPFPPHLSHYKSVPLVSILSSNVYLFLLFFGMSSFSMEDDFSFPWY